MTVDTRACRDWSKWLAAIQRTLTSGAAAVLVSPRLTAGRWRNEQADSRRRGEAAELADHVVCRLSESVGAVHLRRHGLVAELLDRAKHVGTPTIAPWSRAMSNRSADSAQAEMPHQGDWQGHVSPPFLDYLVHCTREPRGPWPGETEKQYADAILAGCAPRDALGSLKRILDGERIIASRQAIRGGAPVVCFSDTPLATLPERKVFRRHRGRWDFLPYGLCVERNAVVAVGGRPVRYGDERCWNTLDPQDKPYFQLEASSEIHWRAESEWRAVGDFALQTLRREHRVFAFTDSDREAAWLESRTRYPVLSLEALTKERHDPMESRRSIS